VERRKEMKSYEHEVHYTTKNGKKYQLIYHRSPWWNGEDHTLKNLFSKLIWWHYSIWIVFKNGGRAESDHGMVRGLFPRQQLRRRLHVHSEWCERRTVEAGTNV
jgi:hypothetical protein